MKKLKRFIAYLSVLFLLTPFLSYASIPARATLIQPESGTKKVVYSGSAEAQKFFRLGYVLQTENNLLGSFAPTTGYSERLLQTITNASTEIFVSSVEDRDGVIIPISAINKGYFTIEPGTSRAESIVCTTASSTTVSLSGCVRGLAASGSDETGSISRAYSHNAASKIIMTNIAQFFGNFVDLQTNQSIGGIKTFTNFPKVPTSTPTLNEQVASKGYVDSSVVAGGVVGTEITPGISQLATQAQMSAGIATTTYSGTDYNLVLQSKYASSTSSATSTIVVTNGSGKIDPSFVTGTSYNFTGTTTLATTSVTKLTVSDATSSNISVLDTNNFINWNNLPLGSSYSYTNLRYSNDAQTNLSGVSNVYLRQAIINRNGTIRVYGEGCRAPSYSAGGEIRKNSTTLSVSFPDTSYPTFSAASTSMQVYAGDVIQLYGSGGQSSSAYYVRNFRIYFDDATSSDVITIN